MAVDLGSPREVGFSLLIVVLVSVYGKFARLGLHLVLVPLNIRCRNTIYNQKGPIILGTTHIVFLENRVSVCIYVHIHTHAYVGLFVCSIRPSTGTVNTSSDEAGCLHGVGVADILGP